MCEAEPVTPPAKKPKTSTEEQRKRKRDRRLERLGKQKADAVKPPAVYVAEPVPVPPAPPVQPTLTPSVPLTPTIPASTKNKKHPTEPKGPPPKKAKTTGTAPVSALARDGPTWVLGTLLKWPDMPDATMVVNDVFRILVSTVKATDAKLIACYRAALLLEDTEKALLTWCMEHPDEFVSLMHLLQILTVAPGIAKPRLPLASSGLLNKLAQRLAIAKIGHEIDLDLGYVPKLAHELRALPGFIKLANDFVNDDEPRGGDAMHAFVTQSDKPKDMVTFIQMFTTTHATTEQAQKEVARVCAAFQALFY